MRKLLVFAVFTASLLIIMSTLALAQVYLPGPGIYLSVTPSVKTVAPGTWVTFYLTAYDIDAYGDPQDVEDSLSFTGWPGPTPSKLAPDRPYESMYSVKYDADGQYDFTVTADDAGTCADDPAVSVTVRLAVGDITLGGIICVSPDGSDENSGLNWIHPKKTIQAAVDAQLPNGEIWVKAGTYDLSPSRITINKDMKLYGGFTGAETQRDPRNLKNNVTTITTDAMSYAMVVSSPTTSYINFTLDGFTFNDCDYGGLGVSHATANITNNTFKNCSGYYGGAIGLGQCTNTNLTGNMIVDNHAQKGGGVYLAGMSSGLAINNNTIVNNTATVDGGGIYAEMAASGTVKNNIIAFNTGGGIKQESSTTPLSLSKNCVNGNAVYEYSGVSHPTDINLNPLFAADYHLISGSPCIDAGVSLPTYTNSDIDSEARVMDGDWDESDVIDIGADEYQDITRPTVTINTAITKDQNVSTITFFGTALDKESGVESVTVRINTEVATSASYDSVTKVWTVTWNTPPPGSQTVQVYVTATDKAGNTSVEVAETVTVTAVPVIYVDGSSGALNDSGTSWQSPKKTISAAILAATDGTEIWVADGAYLEDSLIAIPSGVELYGGFAGANTSGYIGEAAREQRNWAENQTILDGYEHTESVVVLYDVDDCVIDGFIIQRGQGWINDWGGGICCMDASGKIQNNVIRGNNGSAGGGLFVSSYDGTDSLTVSGNVFLDNTGTEGGAIYCLSINCEIINNTIIRNSATQGVGAGIYIGWCSPILSNNIISFNTGSGIFNNTGFPELQKNAVCSNTDDNYSGLPVPPADLVLYDPGIPNIDWGDWHICGNSPCKDQGITALDIDCKDIDANPRSDDRIDIGADEWNGTDPSTFPDRDVKYVKLGGAGLKNGSNWANAAESVQRGIDLLGETGGEVWVAADTYNESIILKSFVKVYGGFNVGDSKSDRNWKTKETSLNGNGASSVVDMSNAVLCGIDGFTICGGGHGVEINHASVTVSHNIIKNNGATNGAGISCQESSGTIANNYIFDNVAGANGGGIYLYNTDAGVINNTITQNTATTGGGGIYISGGRPYIANNIMASNSSQIYIIGTNPALKCNDIWSNVIDPIPHWQPDCSPDGLSDLNGNIRKDPKFVDVVVKDWRIQWDSCCRDTGLDNVVLPVDFDIYKGDRRNGPIDIGAYEGTGTSWRYHITLTTQVASAPVGNHVKVTVHVFDSLTQRPAKNCRVDLSIDAGEVVSISPNEHLTSSTTGWGTTDASLDSNGIVEAYVTRNTAGFIGISVTVSEGSQQLQRKERIYFYNASDQVKVGFIADICEETIPAPVRTYVHNYLTDIAEDDSQHIVYEPITQAQGAHFSIDGSYDVVFLVLPTRDLWQDEIDSVISFVQSGRWKRIVLVGEYIDADSYDLYWAPFNSRLNNVAAALGISTRFLTDGRLYDAGGIDYTHPCEVNWNHYLMAGVEHLWDGSTSVFTDPFNTDWNFNARSLAYTYDDSALPWIIEEDTARAGSRILIHDVNLLTAEGGKVYDTVPDKNFKFVHNLCTIFPQ